MTKEQFISKIKEDSKKIEEYQKSKGYKNELLDALNFLDSMAEISTRDTEGEAEEQGRAYEKLFNYINTI